MGKDEAPELYLDWEERLVGRAFRFWRKLRPTTSAPPHGIVHLADEEAALRVMAQLFAEGRLHLRPSEASGGIRGRLILLPAVMTDGPDCDANSELYLLRAIIDGTRVRLGTTPARGEPLGDEVCALTEAAKAIACLSEDFAEFVPRLKRAREWIVARRPTEPLSPQGARLEKLRMQVLAGSTLADPHEELQHLQSLSAKGRPSPPVCLWGGALCPADKIAAEKLEAEESKAAAGEVTTEIAAPPKDHVTRAFLNSDGDEDIVPMHTFEKVDTLAPFNGRNLRVDGSDELEDHCDALDEVDLRHIIRGGDPAESVYRAELDGLSTIPDVQHIAPGEAGVSYDEWFHRENRYKKDWATVYPSKALEGDETWASDRLRELATLHRRLLRRIEGERWARQWVGRQPDGDEIDLDALIESYGDHCAGHLGSPRLYRRNPRRRRDNATTVLIDVSLSADSWVSNRRILDVSRDAVLLLGEVADALGDRFEILAFASNTRNHCRVWQVKSWRDTWGVGRARLAALSPTGYTRIGPALRHATARLDRECAERKLLLLVTDGKPNDYDRYEGAHGIADVRQATREATRLGIQVHAIGIDPSAATALPSMFGVGGSQVLRTLSDLPEALVLAYRRSN